MMTVLKAVILQGRLKELNMYSLYIRWLKETMICIHKHWKDIKLFASLITEYLKSLILFTF